MVIRYMGTKRHIVSSVSEAVTLAAPGGSVVDLFAGTGSVAGAFENKRPVVLNDAFQFSALLARVRFSSIRSPNLATVSSRGFRGRFVRRQTELTGAFTRRLAQEQSALLADANTLANFMSSQPCVANDVHATARAADLASSAGRDRYELAVLYFAGGYFSLRQAIDIDSLRYAIDAERSTARREMLLAAWIIAISRLINAPGHTAQFLKASSDKSFKRVSNYWTMSVLDRFLHAYAGLQPVGGPLWRLRNQVHNSDALDLVEQGGLRRAGVIYADPPYTQDQYSRFYHVYETLYRYDFPESTGNGRNRPDLFRTGFSRATEVEDSFRRLFAGVVAIHKPLVLSYPTNGLAERRGVEVGTLMRDYFEDVSEVSLASTHSTMGASSGTQRIETTERIYVGRP